MPESDTRSVTTGRALPRFRIKDHSCMSNVRLETGLFPLDSDSPRPSFFSSTLSSKVTGSVRANLCSNSDRTGAAYARFVCRSDLLKGSSVF